MIEHSQILASPVVIIWTNQLTLVTLSNAQTLIEPSIFSIFLLSRICYHQTYHGSFPWTRNLLCPSTTSKWRPTHPSPQSCIPEIQSVNHASVIINDIENSSISNRALKIIHWNNNNILGDRSTCQVRKHAASISNGDSIHTKVFRISYKPKKN